MHRLVRTAITRIAAISLTAALVAGCGGSDPKDDNDATRSGEDPKSKPITITEEDLEAAVGVPQGNASYVANAVAQCLSPVDRERLKLADDVDCEDPDVLGKINPTYAETLGLGVDPGGTTVTVVDETNFSVTARSEDVEGVGVTSWTQARKGSSEYVGTCEPEITTYCVDGKIEPYYG